MRQNLIKHGAQELSYEIRGIVKKAEQLKALGQQIYWENIGDPIQKNAVIPGWMKDITSALLQDDSTYGYCHSKGVLETREFLAARNNQRKGAQIGPEDIVFFNGLGDAIAKLYQFIVPTSRIIGPSPAYSTHSSGEAAHADAQPLTYQLDHNNNWYPDIDDLYNKVKYNPYIVGILIINPDNPTGMVYPKSILEKIVAIAKEFDLFLISDEIYGNITYNGAEAHALAEIIGDLPGMAMKGISKELPWPGSRCGWAEFYNRHADSEFDQLCSTLENAKMVEVCSTKLPQVAIPKILGNEKFKRYREKENIKIGLRAERIAKILGDLPQIQFNKTYGAFYNTIIFKPGVLKKGQYMQIENTQAKAYFDDWTANGIARDKHFVYNLLAAKGVCVVPVSSFCSNLEGFRVTLLEEDEVLLMETFSKIRAGILEYTSSLE